MTMAPTAPIAAVTWLVQEDLALKQKLSGFAVTNYADGKLLPVATYFRFPDAEDRSRSFPHFAIDLVDIQFDSKRAQRSVGPIVPQDLEQATPPYGFDLVADDAALPWMLIYQIGAYSRNPWHDRQLMSILYQAFPQAYGSLNMSNFDGTVRRADFISAVRRDAIDEAKKREYRVIFTIGVSSQFYLNQIQYIKQVTGLNITVDAYLNYLPA